MMEMDHKRILASIDDRLSKMAIDRIVKEKCKILISFAFRINTSLLYNVKGGSICIREFPNNITEFLDELEAFLSSQDNAFLTLGQLANFEATILKSVL